MNELSELDDAVRQRDHVWDNQRILGWVGASTTCVYVSQQDVDRLRYACERVNKAREAAMRKAFV